MNLEIRISVLEKKLLRDDENQPGCIIFVQESGRLNSEPDLTPILQYDSGGISYHRKPGETEEDFTIRAAKAAKSFLPSKNAIPTLFAVTKAMQTTGEAAESTIRG